jgi:hypothetical protein
LLDPPRVPPSLSSRDPHTNWRYMRPFLRCPNTTPRTRSRSAQRRRSTRPDPLLHGRLPAALLPVLLPPAGGLPSSRPPLLPTLGCHFDFSCFPCPFSGQAASLLQETPGFLVTVTAYAPKERLGITQMQYFYKFLASFGESRKTEVQLRRRHLSRTPVGNECVLLAHYQGDLPAPCSVVALEKSVTVVDQIAQREVFTPCPGGFFLQSPTPA